MDFPPLAITHAGSTFISGALNINNSPTSAYILYTYFHFVFQYAIVSAFISDINSGVDYYPGEAMLALIKLYNWTLNDLFLVFLEIDFIFFEV